MQSTTFSKINGFVLKQVQGVKLLLEPLDHHSLDISDKPESMAL
jgi:hypothetical protein